MSYGWYKPEDVDKMANTLLNKLRRTRDSLLMFLQLVVICFTLFCVFITANILWDIYIQVEPVVNEAARDLYGIGAYYLTLVLFYFSIAIVILFMIWFIFFLIHRNYNYVLGILEANRKQRQEQYLKEVQEFDRNYSDVENRLKQIENKVDDSIRSVKAFRKKYNSAIDAITYDISELYGFVKNQFKENTTQILAIFQALSAGHFNHIAIDDYSFAPLFNFLSTAGAIAIAVVSFQFKRPRIEFVPVVLTLTFFQIIIVVTGYRAEVIWSYGYAMTSSLFYFWLIGKAFNMRFGKNSKTYMFEQPEIKKQAPYA